VTLRIDPEQLARVHAHAEEGFPHEVVGILAGSRETWTVTDVAALRNERADSAHNRYKVSGLTLMRAEQELEARGLQIVGYYHSHPDHPSQYSEYDRDHALPNMSYVIVSVMGGAAATTQSWRLTDDRSRMDEEEIAST
jgi:proteasome lid subunit RPN8/RPN11